MSRRRLRASTPVQRALRWLALLLLALPPPLLLSLGPIAQDQRYHRFADQRLLLGIAHFGDVVSNVALVLVGLAGVATLHRQCVLKPAERAAPALFFSGVALTGLGSAWYHWSPDDARLVWDRLPLALCLSAFASMLLAERLSPRAGAHALAPLALFGVASVVWWALLGDLRPYVLVQLYPVLLLVLLPLWHPSRYSRSGDYWKVLACYLAARVCELGDHAIYAALQLLSGHSLKHLLAALAAALVLRMLLHRGAAQAASTPMSRR